MLDWTFEQLQKSIEEICAGEKLVHVTQSISTIPMYVVFKHPTRKIVRLADIHIDKIMRRAKSDGFMTEAEMDIFMREKGIWTDDDDLKVESIHKLIDLRKKKLDDPEIEDANKPYIQEAVVKLEQELYDAELKRERMMSNTSERVARQEKYDYLTWACSYNPETDERIWDSYINYLTYCKEVDAVIKGSLLNEFLKFLVGHTTEQIRYIARNNIWRIDYMVAQAGGMHLLPRSPLDLTPDQKNLIWWTKYYQSIYDMMPDDQPDEYTIEDDEALDEYMAELHKERSQERTNRRAEKRYGTSKAANMTTRLFMRSHPDYLIQKYDKANPTVNSNKAAITLADDPRMSKQHHQKVKRIQKSKRFVPEENK
jgi:hypothetical protein